MGAEMCEHVEEYLSKLNPSGLVECDTSFTYGPWRVNGRADYLYFHQPSNTLHVYDFKYGWSLVDPERNYTLIWHALSYIWKTGITPNTVVFGIFQPRPAHPDGSFRTWEIDAQLLGKVTNELLNALTHPSDETRSGNHCYKCPGLATCETALRAAMNAIDYAEMQYEEQLTTVQLSHELDQLARAENMLKARKQALEASAKHRIATGEMVPNYALETGLGNRRWQSNITADFVKAMTGVDVVAKQTLITPAEAERRGISKDLVKALTERPSTGIKLVREDANKKAARSFGKQVKG